MSLARIILLCTLTSLVGKATSQTTGDTWYLGFKGGIDFTQSQPTPLFDGSFNSFEGGSSVCDTNGHLLFYTNGETVWGSDHQPFPNSNYQEIWENYYGLRTIIVQKPGTTSIYYLFAFRYINVFKDTANLYYSEIDMRLRNGLGDITNTKEILTTTNALEKIAIVKHRNNIDSWVVGHYNGSNQFFSYLLTSTGLTQIPVISVAGDSFTTKRGQLSRGAFKASPDGKSLAMVLTHSGTVGLYHFNNETGRIALNGTLTGFNKSSAAYGAEFSPNSKVLYISTTKHAEVYQFNLQNGDFNNISNSKLSIGKGMDTEGGGLQLGPDGKIYMAQYNHQFLGVIENPNNLGTLCNYVADGFSLGDRYAGWGLPIFPNTTFQVDYSNCNLFVPNTFSPNRDGLNEVFRPISNCKSMQFKTTIYTTWGERIFESRIANQVWDGMIDEETLPAGNYLYTISYDFGENRWQTKHGFVRIIR